MKNANTNNVWNVSKYGVFRWWVRMHETNSTKKFAILIVTLWSFFWSVFSCTRTEYRDLLRKSPYSSEYRKIWTRENSVFGHFHAVKSINLILEHIFKWKLPLSKPLIISAKISITDVWKCPKHIILLRFFF